VISSVAEYADEGGASDAFGILTDAIAGEGGVVVKVAPAIGDEAALHTDTTNVLGYETSRSTLTFRSGRFIGSVEVLGPSHDEVADATMEALGARLLHYVDTADASDATVLTDKALTLDAPAAHYIERYDVLDGDLLRFWNETETQYADRAESYKDAIRVFRQDQGFPDGDNELNEVPRFSVSVFLFPDAETASAWVADVPSRRGVEPVDGAKQFGDESLTVAEAYEWQGVSRTGFRTYIRVGSIVANPTIDGPDPLDLTVLEDLAAVQAECLVAGSCQGPAPVPPELLP